MKFNDSSIYFVISQSENS